jgi:plasmid maintenance system antidote protein VapI
VTFRFNGKHAEIVNYEDYHGGEIINGKAGISPETAARLSFAFNTSSES